MISKFYKYFDFRYFIRFVLILLLIHYFDIFFRGITDPKNIYSPFIDHNLNYVSWLRNSILHTSNILAHTFGLNTHVDGKIIKVFKGSSVVLNLPCLGLGIMSFWIAFIFAHQKNFAVRLQWGLIGVLAIWLINCLRISLLLVALQNKWKVNKYIDHHDLFKLVAYAAIGLMIYFFSRKNNQETAYSLK